MAVAPEPLYIGALEVENVRCFGPRQRLELSDSSGRPARWTLILGENGTGKSTLLQCLSVWSLDSSSYEEIAMGRKPWPERHSLHGMARTAEGARIRIEPLLASGAPAPHHADASFWPQQIERTLLPGLALVVGYGAARHFGDTELSEPPADDPTTSLFDPRYPLLNPEEWLLRMDYQALREGAGSPAAARLQQVKEVLLQLLPDVDRIELREPSATKHGSLAGTVRFLTPYGPVPLTGLGLGYQTMIAWMVDFAARMLDRYPGSPDPLAEPAIVLLDEVDLHLHPRWQRDIVRFLTERFPKTQFIATAHSPLVAQASADSRVVVLRRQGDHVEIDSDPRLVRGWRVDQLLTSDIYSLESARPPAQEALLRERRELLAKPKPTRKHRARVAEIEEKLGALPTAESHDDQRAMDIIREAARALDKRGRQA